VADLKLRRGDRGGNSAREPDVEPSVMELIFLWLWSWLLLISKALRFCVQVVDGALGVHLRPSFRMEYCSSSKGAYEWLLPGSSLDLGVDVQYHPNFLPAFLEQTVPAN
jgi:hypothetical protein